MNSCFASHSRPALFRYATSGVILHVGSTADVRHTELAPYVQGAAGLVGGEARASGDAHVNGMRGDQGSEALVLRGSRRAVQPAGAVMEGDGNQTDIQQEARRCCSTNVLASHFALFPNKNALQAVGLQPDR